MGSETVSIRLMAPLVHGAFDAGNIGNATPIRRLPIVSLPGRPEIPCLSGNALRGKLRRVVMRGLFDNCRLSREDLSGKSWDRLYAALANGGHLDGSEHSVKPQALRDLRAALPPLSVLGSALYKYMLAGRVQIGWCWPICAETVEAKLVDTDSPRTVDAEGLVHETSTVRHVEREQQSPELSGVTPMPVTVETLGTGSVLQSRIRFLPEATPIERAVIAWGLDRIHTLGGKGTSGFGAVEISHNLDASAYTAWLQDNASSARAALTDLAANLTATSSKKRKAP